MNLWRISGPMAEERLRIELGFVQISDMEGSLVRTFMSPAHKRAAKQVGAEGIY